MLYFLTRAKAAPGPSPGPGPAPAPEPSPGPAPAPTPSEAPFGIILDDMGFLGRVGAYNQEAGETFPRIAARISNTGTKNIPVVLVFWRQPKGAIDRVSFIVQLQPHEMKERTITANTTVPDQVGTWTVYAYGFMDPNITTSNFAGAHGQFLDSDTLGVSP